MKINSDSLRKARKLVGKDVSEHDLRHVDCYVSDEIGLFIPSVGFCEYAITPQHVHPAYSFILLLSKEQNIAVPDKAVPENYYLVTAISPDVPHEEKVGDTFTRYIAILISKTYFENEYKAYGRKLTTPFIWKQCFIEHDIMAYLKKFMAEHENKAMGCESVLDGLKTVITHHIIRSILNIPGRPDMISERFEIDRVLDYMNQHFGDKLTIAKLSQIANMSESNFARFFKKETGVSPMEHLVNIRMGKAKKLLLEGSKSITDISLFCGFNSASHFSSSFTRLFKITPSDYQSIYKS